VPPTSSGAVHAPATGPPCGRRAAPRPGRDGVSAETALLGVLAIPGRLKFARAARVFVARTLDGRYSGTDTAMLLTSELVSNSLQYSNSCSPGGVITVVLIALPGGIRAEVADGGGATVPTLSRSAAGSPDLSESGRGLRLVDLLSLRWGYHREGTRTITWFELACAGP
jgi:anti-sigma regulatory factor (Ser/Thr protein kinase)